MNLDSDFIEIQLRSSVEVGRRMIALSAVAHLVGRPSDDPEVGDDDDDRGDDQLIDDHAGERFDWLAWLTQELVLDALSPRERRLLSTTTSPLSNDDLDDQGAAGEALGALAWAVHRSNLTVLDRAYPYLGLLDLVPSPWDDPSPFLSGLTLRSEPEIAAARESIEILTWRAQLEIERRHATGRDVNNIEAAIRDVASEAAAAGVVPIGDHGDLTIGGESVRSLSDEIVVSMAAAARARLRAMSWLCGLGDWDDAALIEM